MTLKTDFDVAFSFAGEDRDFVAQVADCLKNEGVSVFYDKSEEVTLWGKDLTVALDDIYRKKARYVVVFISAAYAKKAWTTFEKGSALAGAFSRVGQDFILPARFDDTDIPGLIPTIAYIELRNHTPQTFAELLANKIRCQEDRDIPAEAQSLTEILNAYLEKFPYRSQSDVIRALDLLDWPESVSLSMFKNAPKPARAEEIAVTTFKPNLVYRVVLATQTEQHYTFKQASRPSKEVRAKCTSPSASPKEFPSVEFGCREKSDEHVTGSLAYDTCNLCDGAGTVAETCRACSGKGLIEESTQLRCDRCRKGTVLALCTRCGGTGFLDVFPFAGRHVSRKDYLLFQNVDKSTIPTTTPAYNCIHEGGIQRALPDRAPFRDPDPAMVKRYSEMLDTIQRRNVPPGEPVSLVREDPYMEKRDISVHRTYLNGCQFRVDACKAYHITYTRSVGHTKGIIFKKESVTTRISGSFVLLDNGTITKVADSHTERGLD